MTRMLDNPTEALDLGALSLVDKMPHEGGFKIRVLSDDATWGNPQPVTRAIQGLLQDGARIALDTWDNREARIRVIVEADNDGAAMAAGEAALMAELGKRNTLTWTPPQAFAPPTVFDVEFSYLEHEMDDEDELLSRRTYMVVLVCQPFARSVAPILSPVMAAPPPPDDPTVVLVDACDSTAGWSSQVGAVATTGGYVYNVTYWQGVALKRTGVIALSSTPYLVIEWRVVNNGSADWSKTPVLQFTGSGQPERLPILTYPLDAGAWMRSTYDLSDAGASIPDATFTIAPTGGASRRFFIRHIDRTDQIPTGGATGHQLSRTIPIEGSARTQASLALWTHGASALGEVLVHTGPTPNGMMSLEPFLRSSATPASGTVSGTTKSLSSPVVYSLTASLFDPDRASSYAVLARVNRAGLGAITATAQSETQANDFGPPQVASASPPSMSAWNIVSLGMLHMPPTRVTSDGSGDAYDGFVRVTIDLASPSGSPVLDDVWLVDMEQGSLTWVKSSLSTDTRLWIDSPSVERPIPLVWMGMQNRVGARVIDPIAWGMHDYPPGDLYIYTVATGVTQSNVQLTYHPRYHTHVAEAPSATP